MSTAWSLTWMWLSWFLFKEGTLMIHLQNQSVQTLKCEVLSIPLILKGPCWIIPVCFPVPYKMVLFFQHTRPSWVTQFCVKKGRHICDGQDMVPAVVSCGHVILTKRFPCGVSIFQMYIISLGYETYSAHSTHIFPIGMMAISPGISPSIPGHLNWPGCWSGILPAGPILAHGPVHDATGVANHPSSFSEFGWVLISFEKGLRSIVFLFFGGDTQQLAWNEWNMRNICT